MLKTFKSIFRELWISYTDHFEKTLFKDITLFLTSQTLDCFVCRRNHINSKRHFYLTQKFMNVNINHYWILSNIFIVSLFFHVVNVHTNKVRNTFNLILQLSAPLACLVYSIQLWNLISILVFRWSQIDVKSCLFNALAVEQDTYSRCNCLKYLIFSICVVLKLSKRDSVYCFQQ